MSGAGSWGTLRGWLWRSTSRRSVYFDQLLRHAELCHEAAGLLRDYLDDERSIGQMRQGIIALKQESGQLTDRFGERLGLSFVPPMPERKDLEHLNQSVRLVLMRIHRAAWTCMSVGGSSSRQLCQLGGILVESTQVNRVMMSALRQLSYAQIHAGSVAMRRLEDAADAAYQGGLAHLFTGESFDSRVFIQCKYVLAHVCRAQAACQASVRIMVHLALKRGDFTHTIHADDE